MARVKAGLTEYDCHDRAAGMNWADAQARTGGDVMGFPRMGPLVGITHRKKVQFDDGRETRTFTVVIHGAYDALGLIGSECNGVGVLDEDNKQVVLDQHLRQGSGYFGPTQAQIDEWGRVCGLSYQAFREFVNANHRSRISL